VRKRSSYRPRGVVVDTMGYVKETLQPMKDRSESTIFKLRSHQALTAIAKGQGTINDVNALVDALNVTEALARLNVGKDWSDEIQIAQDAISAMASRGLFSGKFIFKAPELTAVNLAMEVHDAQLDAVTVGKMQEAILLVRSVTRSGAANVIA